MTEACVIHLGVDQLVACKTSSQIVLNEIKMQ